MDDEVRFGAEAAPKASVFVAGAICVALLLELSLRIVGHVYAFKDTGYFKADKETFTIMCIGDSFVYGLGAPREKSFPAQLNEIIRVRQPASKVRVINTGTPGENSFQIFRRFRHDVGRVKPDLVVFLGGMIDHSVFYGYHSFNNSAKSSKMFDALERVRILKFIRLVLTNVHARRSGKDSGTALIGSGDFVVGNFPDDGLNAVRGVSQPLIRDVFQKYRVYDGGDMVVERVVRAANELIAIPNLEQLISSGKGIAGVEPGQADSAARVRNKRLMWRIFPSESITVNCCYTEALISESVRGYFAAAKDLALTNDREGAIRMANKALAAEPDFFPPYRLLGEIYESAGRYTDALSFYNMYLERYRDFSVALNCGNIYLNMGDFSQAFRAYKIGFEEEPTRHCLGGLLHLYQATAGMPVNHEVGAYLKEISLDLHRDQRSVIQDVLDGRDIDASIAQWRHRNVKMIADECARRAIPLVILGYPEDAYGLEMIAQDRSLPYVDNISVFKDLLKTQPHEKLFSADANHCNAEGYRIMAENLYDALRRHGLLPQ